MMKPLQKLTALSFIAALIVGCASSAEINRQSASQYAQVVQQAKARKLVDTGSATAVRIKNVFDRMVPYATAENRTGERFDWEITVVKSNELNAWAMPGGKMMFYTGLVDRLKLTDDEIAVVMGHEMAHALREHGKASHNLGVATGILGAVAEIGVGVALGANSGGLASSTVDLMTNKPFSRSNETEADEIGLILMAKSGYNPQAAPGLWKKMQSAGGSNVPTILSTHPSDESRQENLQRLLPEAMKYYKPRK